MQKEANMRELEKMISKSVKFFEKFKYFWMVF